MIKAIETRFRGILFRSRIEARWAVFFETLEIPWLYESEGFELPSGKYLPDFWLPRQKLWMEVKGGDFNGSTKHLSELATMSGNSVWLACGSIPSFALGDYWPENENGNEWGTLFFPAETRLDESGKEEIWDGCCDIPFHWCRCKHCGEYGVQFLGRSERIECCPANNGHKDYTADDPTLKAAYDAARNRRFEHGADQWE